MIFTHNWITLDVIQVYGFTRKKPEPDLGCTVQRKALFDAVTPIYEVTRFMSKVRLCLKDLDQFCEYIGKLADNHQSFVVFEVSPPRKARIYRRLLHVFREEESVTFNGFESLKLIVKYGAHTAHT